MKTSSAQITLWQAARWLALGALIALGACQQPSSLPIADAAPTSDAPPGSADAAPAPSATVHVFGRAESYESNYGDLVPVAGGGLILTGHSQSPVLDEAVDFFVSKLGAQGQLEWTTTVGYSSHGPRDDYLLGAVGLPGGDVVVTGYSIETTGLHAVDVPVVRLSPSGELVSSKMLTGAAFFEDAAYDLALSASGDLVLVGSSGSFVDGDCVPDDLQRECAHDAIICRLTVDGDPVWCRDVGWQVDAEDLYVQVRETANRDLVAVGVTASTGNLDGHDILVSRFDQGGQHLWSKTLRSAGDPFPRDMAWIPDDDGIVLMVNTPSTEGWDAIMLVRLDAAGDILWTRALSGGADWGSAIVAAPTGGWALAGMTRAWGNGSLDVLLATVDDSGGLASYQVWPGDQDDWSGSLLAVGDGYVVGGHSFSYPFGAPGLSEMMVLTVDADGHGCGAQARQPDAVTAPAFMVQTQTPTVRSVLYTARTEDVPIVRHPSVDSTVVCP